VFIRKVSVFLHATFHTQTVVLHLKKTYHIELDGVKIGTTDFEFADTPIGVIHGKVNFENVDSPY
jgi:hypothetical protein